MTKLNVLDLFSGIGGMSLGLERAGMKTVAFCEIEPYCQKVLAKHWPDVPLFQDVTKLSKKDLDDRDITIDLLCGGFPCQDISVAGKQAGLSGERSGLWFEMFRLIREIRPSWLLIENVPNLRLHGADTVISGLEGEGYSVWPVVVGAWAVGAPHKRDRVWIVAHANDAGLEGWERRVLQERSSEQLAGQGSASVADSECVHSEFGGGNGNVVGASRASQINREKRQWDGNALNDCGAIVADPSCKLSYRSGVGTEQAGRCELTDGGWWITEPNVGRVANGISKRVDRLKSLGNSVVPQIPEIIGKWIMEQECA